MIIEKLSVTDFRVFRGKHDFDLKPRIKYNKLRPIILYGGLNGAGKTTTLMAVRLALYGKQSLGHGISQKAYDDFLLSCIHRNKHNHLPADRSQLQLDFTYAALGLENHYRISRVWATEGKKVSETIRIYKDGQCLSELNNQQCQAFLNELIPIGVSDLFFFDGEKIAELAEDTGGVALGEAIKKLVGLDVIDTLAADLSVLARNQKKQDSEIKTRNLIEALEKQLSSLENEAEGLLTDYLAASAKVMEHQKNSDKVESEIGARGGAWATSREEEIQKSSALNTEKTEIENQMREILSGNYPLSLAEEFCQETLSTLSKEKEAKTHQYLSDIMSSEVLAIKKLFKGKLAAKDAKTASALIEKQFTKFTSHKKDDILHDISDSAFNRLSHTIDDSIDVKKNQLAKLSNRLEEVISAIDKAGRNIARAPEEDSIKPYLTKLNEIRAQLTDSITEKTKLHEAYRRKLREAIEITRQLDKLSQEVKTSENNERGYGLAIAAKAMLNEFSAEIANQKIKDLQHEFALSFSKLSRKDDVHLSAKISTKDFSVTLINEHGYEVNKDELSAGEKQIYAIAMLEALAKTSGRNLPIIIDTPLGRLDSVHREKLINHYFPHASHQVIILSTDTEVDEDFYSDLSPSISHAYKLDYSPTTTSTSAEETYFWRKPVEEAL